jgi:hypothetical protein
MLQPVEIGGGCASFIKRGIPYRCVGKGVEVVEVWLGGGEYGNSELLQPV